jgi:glutamine amidotransferase
MIGIIDYGLGNIKAISNIYDKLKIKNILIRSKEDFQNINSMILPGVGSFDSAMQLLIQSKFLELIKINVHEKKKNILGICVGMQIFSQKSSEGRNLGLNWFDAEVKKFNPVKDFNKMRLPHMGWNSAKFIKDDGLVSNIQNGDHFYFCHSYYFDCNNKKDIIAETRFSQKFPSIIKKDNIYGIQFHPEKSHDSGVKILENFSKL